MRPTPDPRVRDADADAAEAATTRLILGRVPEDFDADRDLVLGPWCFIGREEAFAGFEYMDYVDPFTDVAALCRAADQVMALVDQLILRLGAELNRMHGRDYDSAFWRVVISPWLLALLQAAWLRYAHVAAFVARHGDRALRTDICAQDVDWRFADLRSFHYHGLTDAGFDHWLSSLMLARLAPPGWRLRTVAAVIQERRPVPPPVRPSGLRGLVRRITSTLGIEDVSGLGWERFVLAPWLRLNARRVAPTTPPADRAPDPDYFPAAFLEVVEILLKATIPAAYTSAFPALEAAALARRHVPGRNRLGCLSQWEEGEKVEAAVARLRGERLFSIQHGGLYGFSRRVPVATDFEMRLDGFISWGWRADGEVYRGRVIPLPSPYLASFRDRHHDTTGRLVLVGTHMRLLRFHLQSTPTPTQWVRYRQEKLDFLSNIGPGLRPAVLYRPYFSKENSLADEPFFLARYPELEILRGDIKALHRQFLGCRLMALDHPGTTLNLALAANVPTVCFWERDAWPVTDAAEPVFQALVEAGILWHRGDQAGTHVARIWPDVSAWWNGADVQRARRMFLDAYGRADRSWLVQWLKAFTEL